MARQKANASLTEQMELSKSSAPVKAGQKPVSLTSKSTHHWVRKVAKMGLDEDKLIARLMVETRKNETLGKCSMPSLIQCAMEAASLDLSFGGVMGQCYPVPFYDSKIKGYRAQLIVGYKGYITVAYREGIVIRAGVFYENDEYDYDEVEELIVMLEQARDYSKWAPKPDDQQGMFEFMAEQKLD